MASHPRLGLHNAPQLSCNLCRERKVKCDKLEPCTNCTAAGVRCNTIYRNRLPRGRHARSSTENVVQSASRALGHTKKRGAASATHAANQELRERIKSLENLICDMSKQGSIPLTSNDTVPARQISSDAQHVHLMDSDMRDPSRTSMNEVPIRFGMPLMTRQSGGSSNDDVPVHMSSSLGSSSGHCYDSTVQPASEGGVLAALGILSPSYPSEGSQQTSILHDRTLVSRLAGVYLKQVDPILKTLHRPSIERWLIHGEGYLQYPERHPSVQALQASICYAAASSLTEQQCQTMLQKSKSGITEVLCRACEISFLGTRLISTDDVTDLQAFVLYLFARKSFDVSNTTWVLVSVAVRIGEKLRLNANTNTGSFFEQQMRKRLWLTICMLDYQTALSQNSDPLVKHESVGDALAQIRHVNDADFGPSSDLIQDQEELTDMTFAYVLFQHQLTGRLLNFGPSLGENHEEIRQQYARDFEEKVLGVLRFCDPESSQLAWFTWHATQCHVAIIRVLRLRPISHSPSAGNNPSRCSNNDPELLRMSLRVLEKTRLMHTDIRGEGFRWYATIPWPMLATTVVGCASCTNVDLALRGWPVLEWWYRQHAALVAQRGEDPSQGILASAMQRASAKVAALSPPQFNPIANSNNADVAISTPMTTPTSLIGSSASVSSVDPLIQFNSQSTDSALDPSFDLSLQMFDPLPWFADFSMDDLNAMFSNS